MVRRGGIRTTRRGATRAVLKRAYWLSQISRTAAIGQRRTRMREMLKRARHIVELAQACDVSIRTVRRDLDYGRRCLGWELDVELDYWREGSRCWWKLKS